MKHGIPVFLWEIGTQVENLIQRYDALEHWRDRVRDWAAQDTSPIDLVRILYSPSLNAKYTLLAAIHDVCFTPDQAPRVNPWPDKDLKVLGDSIGFILLETELLPDACTGKKGLDPAESGRLRSILDDVARSLPADHKTTQDDAQGFADAAMARSWLMSRVRARIESLHESQIEWHGCAVANTNVTAPLRPTPGPSDIAGHLSLIRQDINVVRDWALRRNLSDVPPAPSRFTDREEAQAAFSEWCAYLNRMMTPTVTANKCTILFLAANPKDTVRLAIDEESREIEQKIRAAQCRDSLNFVTKWAVRPDDLLQYLNEFKPHVVHFSGHGSDADEIVLLGPDRQPMPVSKEAMRHLLLTLRGNICVVVLNACYSRTQADAIVEVIDCAIGMKRAIGDEAAIVFSASFYRAIGFGCSVHDAFEQGRAALILNEIPEQDTPELLTRSGVDPKTVFLVAPTDPP